MSNLNIPAPQTYSRLFRPWDCNSQQIAPVNRATPDDENLRTKPIVKNERVASSENMSPRVMKTETCLSSGNESDRECASSNSSSTKSSSFEYSFNNSMNMESSTSPPIASGLGHSIPYTNSELYGSMENNVPYLATHYPHPSVATEMSHLMPSIPSASTSDLYYAAAASAAGLPPVPPNGSFGLNPYTFGLMGQEYARVMAEDAQLKAINARKQRPKKFKCPHCDVAFSNNGQLKGHIRIHTGERPFKCDVETCGKTFTRNEELTRHKRIHTGLRPYPCTACGKKFGRRDHLKKHMKTHMPQERQLGSAAIFVSMYPYLYGY